MQPDDSPETGCYWADKTPCWVLRGCIDEARRRCPAYQDQSKPCWEHPTTLTMELVGAKTCFACVVYRRYGPPSRLHRASAKAP